MNKLLLILTLLAGTAYAVVNPTGKTHNVGNTVVCEDGKRWTVCAPGNEVLGPVVFSENFDSQADWMPATSDEECNGISAKCDDDVPPNWSYYVSNEAWHPNEGYPSHDPSIRISSDQARGGSGKSFIKSNESSQPEGTSNYFTDGILMKTLDQKYDELYMKVWVKFEAGWQWASADAQMKVMRLLNFDGPDGVANPFDYFSDGDSAPMYIFDLRHSQTYGWRHAHAPRCDPQATDYYCTPNKLYNKNYQFNGTPTFAASSGDGNWHSYEVRVKLNSSVGVSDGIFEFWYDGVLQHSVTDILWRSSGSTATGWDTVAIGGNHQNWFDDVANESEQWYAFDDLQVCTERCP